LVKHAHLLQVLPAEATPEARRQVGGQALDQGVPIRRPVLATLLEFHDALPDCPIAGRHERIDATRSGAAGALQQRNDVVMDPVVVLHASDGAGQGITHRAIGGGVGLGLLGVRHG
jgi:hypothetical protein